jgi:TfoX/Sxy family transcriptional regulator of competence genes
MTKALSVDQAPAAYVALARRFVAQPGVSLPAEKRGKFGSNALKVNGTIFAMLVKGALAVKLPPAEVEAATAAGRGEPLSMGRGRVMKEWLVVNEPPRWYAVAERARAFVAGERGE